MRDRWNLVPVEPIGKATVFAHQNRGDMPHVWGDVEINKYPAWACVAGERLRRTRVVDLRMGLREASQRLGLSAVDLCSVERGAMTGDVDAMIAELETSR
jgi:hypothetical protein